MSDAARVQAVWRTHRGRGGRTEPAARAYTAYLVALVGLVYGAPLVLLAATRLREVPDLAVREPVVEVGLLVLALALAGAVTAGRVWGPLVMPPFVLHVLSATDLRPSAFLRRIAVRRVLVATGVLGVPLVALATGVSGSLGDPGAVVVAGLSAVLVAVSLAAGWLWGQVRPLRQIVALVACAALCCLGAVPLFAADVLDVVPALSALHPGTGLDVSLVGGLGVQTALALVLWRAALGSTDGVQLSRLTADSVRAASAQVFAGAGSFHDALDLYRPLPSGRMVVLVRPDGRLRGLLVQGFLRSLRTPWRSAAGVGALVVGGSAVTVATTATPTNVTAATLSWIVGAVLVYLGAGWLGETWRGLRDELALVPLLGERSGGTLGRGLTWTLVATLGVVAVAWAVAVNVVGPPLHRLASSAALVATTTTIALAARFLREMKQQMPLELLTPIPTPFGDLSGARVLAWQLDGVVVVVVGVTLLEAAVAAPAWSGVVVALVGYCLWRGVERVGLSPRSLIRRLGRA